MINRPDPKDFKYLDASTYYEACLKLDGLSEQTIDDLRNFIIALIHEQKSSHEDD